MSDLMFTTIFSGIGVGIVLIVIEWCKQIRRRQNIVRVFCNEMKMNLELTKHNLGRAEEILDNNESPSSFICFRISACDALVNEYQKYKSSELREALSHYLVVIAHVNEMVEGSRSKKNEERIGFLSNLIKYCDTTGRGQEDGVIKNVRKLNDIIEREFCFIEESELPLFDPSNKDISGKCLGKKHLIYWKKQVKCALRRIKRFFYCHDNHKN
jgi:hypothetical protein